MLTFNAFHCRYEENWLIECPHQFNSVVYRSYVDINFDLFTSEEYSKLFVNYVILKKQEHKIKI